MRILLLEDDIALAMGIEYSLKSEGYEVTHIPTFNEGKIIIENINVNDKSTVGIFDVMLPDGNGFDLLTLLRDKGINIPIIFLTAMSDEINVVQGLDLGADDYITKPFHVKELMSRLKAVIRRYRIGEGISETESKSDNEINKAVHTVDNKLYFNDLIVDTLKAAVYKKFDNNDKKIELTQSEYKLLLLFLNNKNVILERDLILDKIFDSNGSFVDDNTLSVYMKRLRTKLGDEYNGKPYIKTVRGIGYIMED
ncbi:MAG: response regulator transcription factor [Lachnospiraceae bacterium]|nr:response regulator transcription factor [Lachnospiraceae bacterium]